MDDAGDEVGEGGDEDDLERGAEDGEEQVHGDGFLCFGFLSESAGRCRPLRHQNIRSGEKA